MKKVFQIKQNTFFITFEMLSFDKIQDTSFQIKIMLTDASLVL